MSGEPETSTRIVIAEDDPVSRRVLEVFLIKRNYDVVAVSNGTDALRALEEKGSPRLAVLDWMMPGMEGVQVCEQIRKQKEHPYIYILMLTARSQKEDLLRGLEAGADDYLTKPFDPQELHARLKVGQRILDLQDHLLRAKEELRYRATYDALTDIPNRAVILDTLKHEQSRQRRTGGGFGLLIADLDHFKRINDTYGHACGDTVLKEVASRMKASVRDYDTVGRYGGEEFLIVVPETDKQGLMAIAERIRTVIGCNPVVTEQAEIRITASLGAAVSTAARPVSSEMLLKLADEALYRAKEYGRNRTELAAIPENVGSTEAPARFPG